MITPLRSDAWISNLKRQAEETFVSPSDVDRMLKEIAHSLGLDDIGVKISIKDVVHRWGSSLPHVAVKETINAAFEIDMEILLPASVPDAATQRQLHDLLEALKMVWSKEFRNEHGGWTLKASGAGEIFNSSVRHLSKASKVDQLSVVYIDLDNFRQVNNKFSHETGNHALRRVYSAMHETARKLQGLVFFDGGDEFIMIAPTTRESLIASSLADLRGNIRAIQFRKESDVHGESVEVSLDMTAGVVVRGVGDICSNINAIKTECEDLTKSVTNGGLKKRGTINFEPRELSESAQQKLITIEQFFKLGIIISKSRLQAENPFTDDFLNLIAQRVAIVESESIDSHKVATLIEELTSWFGKTVTTSHPQVDESGLLTNSSPSDQISEHSIIVSIVHGLSIVSSRINLETGAMPISIIWRSDTGEAAAVYGDHILWGTLKTADGASRLAYGPVATSPVDAGTSHGAAILVQIGFPDDPRTVGGNLFPEDAFISHVRVDARPAMNGGLPDFWQIALAQVVSHYARIEGGIRVLVWGHRAEETLTYARLTGTGEWNNDEVAALTGLRSAEIQEIGLRLSSSVKTVKTADHLLDEVYDAYQAPNVMNYSRAITNQVPQGALLPRAMAAATPLRQSEGIVCRTASIAYPLVIDTLRKSEDVRMPIDDADQELRELIAFKIKLTEPGQDPIPHYLRDNEKELRDYADRVLLDKAGLIRTFLEKDGQRLAFVRHLSGYFRSGAKHRSTRRACLVVPHHVDSSGDPKPLGLISVWATPRFEDGKRFIDFVFVWRTVEAFIGLPYSLYGSVRLAEALRDEIRDISRGDEREGDIELGELTYVALSIHLGSDEFHMRVAKHIVDAASD